MIRRSARTTLVTAACGAVLATGLAACGTVQQLSAADKVSTAFDKLGRSKSFSAKLSVDATAEQIEAFGAATGEKIDKETAAALTAVNLSVAFSADKPLKDVQPSKGANGEAAKADPSLSSSVALTGKGGASLFELRQVGDRAYARADLAGFARLVGEDASEIDQLTKNLPAALQGALKGSWVSFDAKQLQEPGGAGGTGASPAPTLDPKAEEGLTASLKDILDHDLSFEDKGKQDGKERITVTAPARKLTDDLLKAFAPLAKDVPNLGKLPTTAPKDVPDRNLALDLYLDGGALSAMTFDLAQLEEKPAPGSTLPLRIAFGKDAPAVQAPADAATISSEEIAGLIGDFTAGLAADAADGSDGADSTAPWDGPGDPAEPLTDAQVKELTAGGAMNEEQVRLYNKLGMSYQDIKDLAALGS
ncbi:hypothetical protein ABT093_37265 [Kitasatospora sp. NPDC002551]|uniref:hypothetical protein n=1 Tax=Kitasatospora sp. NPDC002551 TaxID=3154539 RepID=UPI0033333FF9